MNDAENPSPRYLLPPLWDEIQRHVVECDIGAGNGCEVCEVFERMVANRRADEATRRRQAEEEAKREFKGDD